MAPNFFRALLAAVAIYAWLKGGRDERAVSAMCVIAAIATTALLAPLQQRFHGLEYAVFLIDLALSVGLIGIALRSNHFSPLWVAGLQLTTIMGHVLKGVYSGLIPRAYAASLNFWAYPIIIILAIGTWRSSQRPDRDDFRAEI
ncbi:MAG: hypothetical protein H0W71_05590 [Sphingomonas sp.]|nr:hypothetical protein [Sphingomonas sp.]